MVNDNATTRLGAWLSQAVDKPLSPDVAEKTAICLLDATGLSVLAHAETTAAAARRISVPSHNKAASRLWADGRFVAPSEAALANGIAAHAHFQDDTDHDSWSHPGSLVPPATLALAEAREIGLTQTLRATAAGYAVMKWLGIGEDVSRKLIARGLRTSPTFGAIGAAAGCAVSLGLDAREAASAIGIAAANTGGTLEPVRCGSDEWRIQNGRAAQCGLTSALLASEGVMGAPDALEGARGFLFALAGTDKAPAGWQSDPDTRIMMQIMAKPFATLGDNMFAASAAYVAHQKGLDPRLIERVSVTVWRPYSEYPGTAYKGPYRTQVQTQASTVFAVATMLRHGQLTYELGERGRADLEQLALVALTEVVPHDGEYYESTITVTLRDGSTITARSVEAPKTLIYQDAARATEVFEERLFAVGHPRGHGAEIARKLLGAARNAEDLDVSFLLNGLPVPNVSGAEAQ